jgi:membrane protease YdiL (CAAX protease family)
VVPDPDQPPPVSDQSLAPSEPAPDTDQPPTTSHRSPTARERPTPLERAVALLEVLICSDYPTQFALASTFAAVGYRPFAANGRLLVGYVVTLSLIDTALLIALILLFLHAHGERPRDVFVGARGAGREALAGVLMTFVALGIGIGILLAIQKLAPSLHTVEHNPFQELLQTRRGAAVFALVAIVAGGVREEIQRAFLLHRFDAWLGGGTIGVLITSAAFGAGHLLQGVDAAIATGTLGAFWGLVYLWRRSAVAPVVSHSGFNLLQIVQYLAVGG